MALTARLKQTLLEQAQTNAHITANTLIAIMDAMMGGVIDRNVSAEPGSPSNGDVYVLPAGALTGAAWSTWSSTENDLAVYYEGWYQISLDSDDEGIRIYVMDEDKLFIWSGSAWTEFSSGGGGMQELVFTMNEANFAGASVAAVPVYRNGLANLCLGFPDAAAATAIFESYLPSTYGGGGLTVELHWMAATATSGDVQWAVAIERNENDGHDHDADAFASDNTVDDTAASTSGSTSKALVTFTSGADMDSLVAGECFRVRVKRNGPAGGDDMSGDAQLLRVVIKET